MGKFGGLGLALLLISGCGELGSRAEARIAGTVCDEICGWPDECFAQLAIPLQGDDCVPNCVAQVDVVGLDCIDAIASTVSCLGTCDPESLTDEEILACQDEARGIELACD